MKKTITMKCKNNVKKTNLLLLLFWLSAVTSFAQQSTNTGTHFFLAFGRNDTHKTLDSTQNSSGKYIYNVELMLRITSLEQSEVTLHFTKNPSLDKIITVNAGEIINYKLSFAQINAVYSGGQTLQTTPNKNSLEVTATQPISLIAMSSANASVEATLVFPVEVLGKEYVHAGMTRTGNGHSNGYIIVATEDNTVVTHYTKVIYLETFTTKLNKGEVYHYNYSDPTNWNPAGAHLVSDKPIAFFQNGTKSSLSNSENYSFEQLPPVHQWGTKFVLPATYNIHNGQYAGFARVSPKTDENITGTVTYSNGNTASFTIKPKSSVITETYYDAYMNSKNQSSATACYITTDKPVNVCAYTIPRGGVTNDMAQPAAAWLPPVEQITRNVIITPLDFNGSHVYVAMQHFFTVITPTATKDSTTISIDGGAPQLINTLPTSTFTWVADNVGGSGYSFGQYYFGESNVATNPPKYLKTVALVDNPEGIMILAYGEGSYTNYYYTVGSGTYDLLSEPTTTLTGTVFPFVRWNNNAFDTLFPITVNLKSVPNPLSANPLEDLINETPLQTTEAIYYDGSVFVPNSPKFPGFVGALNNYGLPIDWMEAIHVSGGTPITNILQPGEQPATIQGQTLGLFKIEDVTKGDYILEIKREGFVTRWAKISVDASKPVQYLGHRELVPGDVASNRIINLADISAEKVEIGGNYSIPTTQYTPKYDLNADGKINQLDFNLILKFEGFWYYHYEETMKWLKELGIF